MGETTPVTYLLGWWQLQTFSEFSPRKLGKMIQFDDCAFVFQTCWFNHQLDKHVVSPGSWVLFFFSDQPGLKIRVYNRQLTNNRYFGLFTWWLWTRIRDSLRRFMKPWRFHVYGFGTHGGIHQHQTHHHYLFGRRCVLGSKLPLFQW